MSLLKNPKHERFAQELAGGKTADEAYKGAGYVANRFNASRLKTNEHVLRRVTELQSRAADGVVISRQKILEELASMALAPLGHEVVKSEVKRAALMDIAKLEG
jgi:phage terminase small subunit